MPKLIDADALSAKLETMARDQWNHRVAPTSWSHAYLEFADMLEREPQAKRTAPPVGRCWECAAYADNKCLNTGYYKPETGF